LKQKKVLIELRDVWKTYTVGETKVNALIKKVDSIQTELNRVQNIVGSTSDKTLGLILNLIAKINYLLPTALFAINVWILLALGIAQIFVE